MLPLSLFSIYKIRVIILKYITLVSVLAFENWILIQWYQTEVKSFCTVELQSEPSISTTVMQIEVTAI